MPSVILVFHSDPLMCKFFESVGKQNEATVYTREQFLGSEFLLDDVQADVTIIQGALIFPEHMHLLSNVKKLMVVGDGLPVELSGAKLIKPPIAALKFWELIKEFVSE